MFEVSKFIEGDTEQWKVLWSSFEDGHRPMEESYEVCKKNWPRILNDEKCHALALRNSDNGEAVGFILYAYYWCAFSSKDECYISALFVLPEWRKKKGAKLLIDAVIDNAKSNNLERVTWLTKIKNKNAISLYDHYGEKEEWIRYKVQTS